MELQRVDKKEQFGEEERLATWVYIGSEKRETSPLGIDFTKPNWKGLDD